ncbi:MAG: hypothetical protein FJZ11_03245 [Candidatus Omnitrophica bacterium]|nr:hypothetical protein [Candidatus Omnitrophota bacterium]
MPSKEASQRKEIQEGKIFALMAYLFALCIIPLIFKKENKFALFHAKQGLVIFLGEVTIFVVSMVPGFGYIILDLGKLVFGLLSLLGMIQSISGKYTKIPIIFDIAEKISI